MSSPYLISITAVIKAKDFEEEEVAQSDTYSTLNLWSMEMLIHWLEYIELQVELKKCL